MAVGLLLFATGRTQAQAAACGEQLSTAAIHKGVAARSNGADMRTGGSCDNTYGIDGWHYQCVEYIRNFYRAAKGVDTTASVWKGNANTYFAKAQERGLTAYPNSGSTRPEPDDILVWNGGTYGHVAIVAEVTDTQVKIIEQNWSNSGVRSLPLNFSNGNYSIPPTGTYSVVGWVRKPAPPTSSNAIVTNATINGQPYSGGVNYDIVGPNGVIIGTSVPGETVGLPSGDYRIIYRNGGPSNGTLSSITPSSAQSLTDGGTITFSLNFSTESVRWLSFVEGDPGVAGDGVVVNSTGGQFSFNFDLSERIRYQDAPAEFTVTIFPVDPNPDIIFGADLATYSDLYNSGFCNIGSVGGSAFDMNRRIVFNGAIGFYSNFAREDLVSTLDFINEARPGCNYSFNDLYFKDIWFYPNASSGIVIDGAAIGVGLDNFPGTLVP